MDVAPPLFFDLALHLGTLVVVTAYLRKDLVAVLRGLARGFAGLLRRKGARASLWDDKDCRLGLLVGAASVPTAAIGFAFRPVFEGPLSSMLAVGVGMLATGAFLLALRLAKPAKEGREIGLKDALLIGTAQGISVTPSVSRSGLTIGTALLRGIPPGEAARFSFLLSIPAIAGAAAFEASSDAIADASAHLTVYAAGVVTAMVFGYLSLTLLVRIVKGARLPLFGYYCLAAGAAVVVAAVGYGA
jgi:undecaprenyl-diphosphatase